MDEDVFGRDCPDHLAVVDGAVLEPAIGRLDEDLRLVIRRCCSTRWMPRTSWPIASP